MPFCNLKKIFYLLLAALAVLLSGCAAADPYKTISTSIKVTFQEDSLHTANGRFLPERISN